MIAVLGCITVSYEKREYWHAASKFRRSKKCVVQAMRRRRLFLQRTEVECMAQSVVDRSHIHMPRLRLTSGQLKRPSIVAYRG